MAAINAPVKFFLGANTPNGFVGFTDDLYDVGWQAYLIKSGPGTGKSTLMKRVYERLAELSIEGEAICCSSDPSSLDGVRFPQLKLCIFDATAPHVIEPRYWGAVEQLVPLSVCMDETALRGKANEIVDATEQNRALHARCRKYLHAVSSLLRENRRIGEGLVDVDKVRRMAQRIATQEFGENRGRATVSRRFLSAVTPEGLITLYETLQTLCPRIYTIEDEQGAASRLLLAELLRHAQAAGIETIVCPCPLAPEEGPEHLLFPTVGVGFTTSNTFHKADFPVYRRIHATRFMDAEALRGTRQRQAFNRRAAGELLEQARTLAAEAKTVHDTMESYSIAAMDWEQAAAMGEAIVQVFVDAARNYRRE
ncbi:MAG: hypothetical protein IKB04_08240 [Clostridia bacterium]|nr:hypothetical protein [Clostridia bacterium]